MNQVPTSVTAMITALAALPAQMLVAWAAKNGYSIPAGYEQYAAAGIAMLIGAASQRFAVLNKAIDDITAAAAASVVRRYNAIGQSKAKAPPPVLGASQSGFSRVGMLVMLLALVVPFVGCAWMSTKSAILEAPAEKSLPEIGQKAQTAVNAATATLATVYTFARDGLRSNTLAVSDFDKIMAKADKFRDDLRQAQDLINAGGFDAAQAKAQATQALIKILHDEAVAAAAKRSELPLYEVPLLLGA